MAKSGLAITDPAHLEALRGLLEGGKQLRRGLCRLVVDRSSGWECDAVNERLGLASLKLLAVEDLLEGLLDGE